MSDRPVVFLLSAPRSGSTWLQRMLGTHPGIVTPQETDLFDRYVAALARQWHVQIDTLADAGTTRRAKGLPAVVTAAEFDALVGTFVKGVFDRVAALDPVASVIVEKTPGHALQVPAIRRHLPDARFVHLLRDGRDVANSLVTASRGWGARWAPADVGHAARTWRRHVDGARVARELGAPYLEVRYEDLCLSQAPARLRAVLEFCGVEATEDGAAALLDAHTLAAGRNAPGGKTTGGIVWGGEVARRLGSEPAEPPGFIGEGGSGSWRSWTAYQRWAFREAAGPVLVDCGYEPDDRWAGSPAAPPLAAFRARRAAATLASDGRRVMTRWRNRSPVHQIT